MADPLTLPACPTCGKALDPARLLWRDNSEDRHQLVLSCAGCLAAVQVDLPLGHVGNEPPIFFPPRVHIPGSATARLRERLNLAREDGRLEAELGAVFASEEMGLLGTPEIFRDLKTAIGGGYVRLVRNVIAGGYWHRPYSWPVAGMGEQLWVFEERGGDLTEEQMKRVDASALGGFLVEGGVVTALRATRFKLIGIQGKRFALAAPIQVTARHKGHPGFLVDPKLGPPARGRP